MTDIDLSADSLQAYCEARFPDTFHAPWTEAHRQFFDAFTLALAVPRQTEVAMRRGEGATSLINAAAVFAVESGLCRYVRIVAMSELKADHAIRRIAEMLPNSANRRRRSRLELEAGAVIEAAGILSSHRGCIHQGRDGKRIRPDLWLVDWPEAGASVDQRRAHALRDIMHAASERCAVVVVEGVETA